MTRNVIVSLSLFVVYALLLVWLVYFSSQTNFTGTIIAYTGMFACYLLLLFNNKRFTQKTISVGLLLLHLIPLLTIPPLSPDVYRFLWDGEIISQGINPYAFTPEKLITLKDFQFSGYLKELYKEMTQLSRSNFSPYPTTNQLYFIISSFFTDNIWINIVVLRILVIGTHLLGFYYLKKLLNSLNISTSKALILALNPFLIVEFVGNLHFEGVMFSWLIIGFYFIMKKRLLLAGLFFAIAITIKLTPLLLVPFFFNYLGWKKWLQFGVITGGLTILILSLFLWPSVLGNFTQSLNLYFSNFEFNASFFLLFKLLLTPVFGYDTVAIVGPAMSVIAMFTILGLALRVKKYDIKDVFTKMLFAYVIYLLLSTTVHPWYILIPLGLSLFTRYSFMIFWSFTIMFSYIFYQFGEHLFWYILLIIEYGSLFGFLIYEKMTNKRILPLHEI